MRLEIARAQIPEILAWAGVLTLLFGIVNAATLSDEGPVAWAVNLVFGPVFIGLAWAIRRRPRASTTGAVGLGGLQRVARRPAGEQLPRRTE